VSSSYGFLEISKKRANLRPPRIRNASMKAVQLLAAKPTAPCFGFVDASRSVPIPTPRPNESPDPRVEVRATMVATGNGGSKITA
jgi:hypothetical protein